MRKKLYWLALIPLAAVWIYAVGRSAGELLELVALVDAAPAEPIVTVEAPSRPLVAPVAAQRDDEAPATTPAPRQVTLPTAEPAPRVYAAAAETVADDAEPLDHPEVTDPRLRKLLQPAWDD
jgi:hypothetical protein